MITFLDKIYGKMIFTLITQGINILAENFISYVNEFVLTKSNSFWLTELSAKCSESSTKDTIHPLREAMLFY